MEHDDFVNTVQELGTEMILQRIQNLVLHARVAHRFVNLGEAHIALTHIGSTQVGRHDDHRVTGSAEEVFDEVKAAFEKQGWVYEEGESTNAVVDAQWFVDPDDESVYVGVFLSSPEELKEYEMVVPDGIVRPGSSVVQVYYWP